MVERSVFARLDPWLVSDTFSQDACFIFALCPNSLMKPYSIVRLGSVHSHYFGFVILTSWFRKLLQYFSVWQHSWFERSWDSPSFISCASSRPSKRAAWQIGLLEELQLAWQLACYLLCTAVKSSLLTHFSPDFNCVGLIAAMNLLRHSLRLTIDYQYHFNVFWFLLEFAV